MKSPRDLQAELLALRTSLKPAQRSRASLAEMGAEWLKDEVDRPVPTELQGRIGKWRDYAEELLSTHPIASTAIALCIGLALGQLWRRRHDQ